MPQDDTPASSPDDAAEFTFGIEEEYFVVDRKSGGLRAELLPSFFRALTRRFGDQAQNELLQCQIEVATRPHSNAADVREELLGFRTGIGEIAHHFNLGIVAAGTHPTARYSQMLRTRKRRYEKVIADLQMVGMASAYSALHVHVGVPDPDRRVEIMYRMIPFLPIFLALSTSSPFWEGNSTGLLSYRSAGNKTMPRGGMPELFRSMDEYQHYVCRLVEANIIPDSSYIWWSLRPSLQHPTLELRIMDCCTSVADSVALASLYRALVRHLYINPGVNADFGAIDRALVEENIWRAQRYGTEGTYLDLATAETRTFRQELASLLALIADDAAALGCSAEIDHIRTIASRGTAAHRQLALFQALRASGKPRVLALREVIRWLRTSTETGEHIGADSPLSAAA